MSDGFGYFDEHGYVFEGFSFGFNGNDGSIDFIPTRLVYPELGNDPGNIVGLKVVLVSGSIRGEQVFGLPIPTISRLYSDLQRFPDNGDALAFPSPNSFMFVPPYGFECIAAHPSWSEREWQIRCRLSNFESANDPNSGRSATLEVFFMLNVASIQVARRDLAAFLQYLSAIEKKQ